MQCKTEFRLEEKQIIVQIRCPRTRNLQARINGRKIPMRRERYRAQRCSVPWTLPATSRIGGVPRAPVWVGLLEDKNSVVFGPAESLRGLLIGRGRWWRGEDDEEATEKESDPRSNCQRSFHGARHYCPCHPLALKPWQALSRDGSITLAF